MIDNFLYINKIGKAVTADITEGILSIMSTDTPTEKIAVGADIVTKVEHGYQTVYTTHNEEV
jgi:hypothetical protein